MINAEIVYDKDYFRTVFNILKNTPEVKKFRNFLSVFCLAVGLIYLYVAYTQHFFEGSGVTCTVIGVLFVLVGVFKDQILTFIHECRIKKVVSRSAAYCFSEEGLAISSELGEAKYKWDAFDLSGTESHYLWIRRKFDRTYIPIDKNRLTAEDAAQLQKWFSAAKG